MGNKNGNNKEIKKEEEEKDKPPNELQSPQSSFNNSSMFSCGDSNTPINILLNLPPKNKKIEEPKKYESPRSSLDIDEDNRKNRYFLGDLFDSHRGRFNVSAVSNKDIVVICDGCEKKIKTFYHCLCCEDFDLCSECHGLGVKKEKGFHFHNENNFFTKMNCTNLYLIAQIKNEKTSTGMMSKAFRFYKDRFFIGERDSVTENKFKWLKYGEVFDIIVDFSTGLRSMGLKGGDFVGILGKNSFEGIICDFSCFYGGFVSVPIQEIMTTEEKSYVVKHTKIKYIVTSEFYLDECLRMKKECESLERIIVITKTEEKIDQDSFYGLLKKGRDIKDKVKPVFAQPEDILTIVFTSGSTGKPKGVVYREKNWINRSPAQRIFPLVELLFSSCSHLSGRLLVKSVMLNGGRFAILTGNNMKNIFKDFDVLNPTYLSAPPRLLDKIYEDFKTTCVERMNKSKDISEEEVKKIKFETFMELRKKKIFGDKITTISTGGGPVNHKTKNFIRNLCSVPVYEGYGSSEVGSICYNYEARKNVKLKSLPDLGYTILDKPHPRGEVCVKDEGVMEYFGDHKLVVDDEGYYHTGDIAKKIRNYFVLIDRKTNIIKLNNGLFISIERIEKVLKESIYISNLVVLANHLKTKLFGIIVPTTLHVSKEDILKDIILVSQKNLRKHEMISNIIMSKEKFSVENMMLTVSGKLNRRVIKKTFQNELRELFNEKIEIKKYLESKMGLKHFDEKKTLAEMGVDSLSAIKLYKEVKELKSNFNYARLMNCKISDIFKDIFNEDKPETNDGSDVISIEKEEKLLGMDKLKFNFPETKKNPRTFFVTGATGFVGSFIVRELLDVFGKDVKIYCLVRWNSVGNLIKDPRVEKVIGDLSKVKLGILDDHYDFLKKEIDIIVHCGFNVNHILSYNDLYDVNVGSMVEIMKLSNGKSEIHFISSISALGRKNYIRKNGYSSSKWVSESMLMRNFKKFFIYRLNLVGISKKIGVFNRKDWFFSFVKAIIDFGIAPPIENELDPIDIFSVDFTSKFIVNSILKQNFKKGNRIFNFSKKNICWKAVIEFIKEFLEGKLVFCKTFSEWIRLIEKKVENWGTVHEIYPFIGSLERRGKLGGDDRVTDPENSFFEETEENYNYSDFVPMFKTCVMKN